MPKSHYLRECPVCHKRIVQMSHHFQDVHKTSITDWQVAQREGSQSPGPEYLGEEAA